MPVGVSIVLVGDGQEKNALIAKAKSLNVVNVQFFDPIPKNVIPSFLQFCDVAYIGAKRSKLYRHGVFPNKLMDYVMADIPVLYAIAAGNNPVKEAGCGVSVKAEDSDDLVRGIQHFRNLDNGERRNMGRRGKEFALQN